MDKDRRASYLSRSAGNGQASLKLQDGARVAVMGGGPAGSLFSYFILEMAERLGLTLDLDLYEPRDFSRTGPAGCNMCAGIISESLVQMLALEGINLPPAVVQRGMDSYMLHTAAGRVRLTTPYMEKRIGTVFRGAGPRGTTDSEWVSFDGFLLEKAVQQGASLIRERVEGVDRLHDRRLQLKTRAGSSQPYDFLAVATGVNTNALRLFQRMEVAFQPPRTARTFVREYYLGKEYVERTFGHTIHFFMLDLEGLDFAAIVPKGNYVTICLLGTELQPAVFAAFLDTPQVRSVMPPEWNPEEFVCHCGPRINVHGAVHPFADRMVFLGDIGVSRLYKDGVGAAYRAAKAAAAAVIYGGMGDEDLKRRFGRSSRLMEGDNSAGRFIFAVVGMLRQRPFTSRAILRMIASEQRGRLDRQYMSSIMWDTFTGSAPYRDILVRTFNPAFLGRFIWHIGVSIVRRA